MLRSYGATNRVMLCAVTLLALLASTQGRAVNISNTWVLPEEGFPVFYRYFRDRISWYEADAVCQFHHANLVTVDTTAQYDAVRAYLKELDITSAVWVGLIRSNPDGDFTWTDYRGLSGDGYWSSAPDARTAPLCAAANPTADYRWEARACGGPTVASFICELPVPQWALGNEGCMVRELPALTILYLPESAAVQLTADCGMAGVKRVQCTGNVKRENLLKELSCNDELTSTSSVSFTGVTWPLTSTDTSMTDQDVTNEITTTEENIVTDQKEVTEINLTQSTPIPYILNSAPETKLPIKPSNFNKVLLEKQFHLNIINNNNMQSNDIPTIAEENNYLTEEQLNKIEDEKHMQHKMLHEQFARHGNFENIFTQPTDHFVPPLVMAKAKISDDMTVLSLEEKHAQQLAEQKSMKYNTHDLYERTNKTNIENPKSVNITDMPNGTPVKHTITEEDYGKKEKNKNMPKKYSDKYYEPKSKILKANEFKNNKSEKLEVSTQSTSTLKNIETSTMDIVDEASITDDSGDTLDLKVIIKDDPIDVHQINPILTNYSGDITKLDVMLNSSLKSNGTFEEQTSDLPIQLTPEIVQNNTNHEVITITILTEDKSTVAPIVFEITTKAFENNFSRITNVSTVLPIISSKLNLTTDLPNKLALSTSAKPDEALNDTSPVEVTTTGTMSPTELTESTVTAHTMFFSNNYTTEIPKTSTVILQNVTHDTTEKESETTTVNLHSSPPNVLYNEGIDMELDHNSTDSIDDFQSPLLSAASEPLHRPNRSRRPQQPNRTNKFNPFRILG